MAANHEAELRELLHIPQHELETLEKIGERSDGIIFKGTWKHNGKSTIVALKKIRVNDPDMIVAICQELKIMQSYYCEHICKIYGGCWVDNGEQVWLVMEYVEGGDLHDLLTRRKEPLPYSLLLSFCVQATRAVISLHSFPTAILHRDIKSHNFLVKNNSTLVLADFGFLKAKTSLSSNSFTLGSPRWAAPEIIASTKPKWSEKADIYSLGMLFYEIVARQSPYHDEPNINIVIKNTRYGILPKFPSDCPEHLAAIIRKCWNVKPYKRPTALEILDMLLSDKQDRASVPNSEQELADNARMFSKADTLTEELKKIARDLLGQAYSLLDQEKQIEAKCYLEVAVKLDSSLALSRLVVDLQACIKEREELSEHDRQMRIELRINGIKEDIQHAEQQAKNATSEVETEMLAKQLEELRIREEALKERVHEYEARYQKLEQRERHADLRDQFLSGQTQQLEQLLAELQQASPALCAPEIQQQIANIESGDRDISAAKLRFESLQKSAKIAQQALVTEERRQRERVEWMHKQLELYRLRGMSPEQKTYRNFLKDVKRLSSLRHQYTPHPLQCFISYAWETDAAANKELQQRLQRLKDDLEVAGMRVKLDIRDMKYDMKKFMVENIEKAHKLLLVCTPRLQERAAYPSPNNLQLELQTAVEKEKTTPEFITPLLFSGSFSTSMPPQVSHLLSLTFTPGADYISAMSSQAPMGLIPMLLGLEDSKDYKRIHERLVLELAEFENAKL